MQPDVDEADLFGDHDGLDDQLFGPDACRVVAADDVLAAGVSDGASLGSLLHFDDCQEAQPNRSVPDVDDKPQLKRRAMQALAAQNHWETFEHPDLLRKRIDENGSYFAQCRRCRKDLKQNPHDFNHFMNHLRTGCKYQAVGIRSGPISRGQIVCLLVCSNARSLAALARSTTHIFARSLLARTHALSCSIARSSYTFSLICALARSLIIFACSQVPSP